MLSAADISAQSVFVQGSAAAEVKRFSGEPENTVFDGTAGAITFGVGGHITAHWTVGAELDLGAPSTTTTTTSVSVSGQNRDIHDAYTSQRRSVGVTCSGRAWTPLPRAPISSWSKGSST